MSDKVIEVVHGKHHKFEIIRKSSTFSTEYYIRRDGKPFKGPYSRLDTAVEAAEEEV